MHIWIIRTVTTYRPPSYQQFSSIWMNRAKLLHFSGTLKLVMSTFYILACEIVPLIGTTSKTSLISPEDLRFMDLCIFFPYGIEDQIYDSVTSLYHVSYGLPIHGLGISFINIWRSLIFSSVEFIVHTNIVLFNRLYIYFYAKY